MRKDRDTAIAEKFQACFHSEVLAKMGQVSGYAVRNRKITPERFVPSLLSSLAGGKVDSLADLHRDFERDHGISVNYKPFYERMDSDGFAKMMENVAQKTCEEMRASVLSAEKSRVLHGFEDIIIHDGTSFALRDGLALSFPGRFSAISPAAVELHVSMSLFSDNLTRVVISADKESERHFTPSPESLKSKLFLADRGYDGIPYLRSIDASGGFFDVRMRKMQDPMVSRPEGKKPGKRDLRPRRLSEIIDSLAKSKVHDFDAIFSVKGEKFAARLVLRWNRKSEEWIRLVTNVSRSRAGKLQIMAIYRLRWQIELVFKQLKSFSCLRKFQTNKESIALGLIWATIAAAFLKRFIAHSCQEILYGENISTHKMAKCGWLIVRIFRKIEEGTAALVESLTEIASFARRSLKRSRIARDLKRGRLTLGVVLSHQEA